MPSYSSSFFSSVAASSEAASGAASSAAASGAASSAAASGAASSQRRPLVQPLVAARCRLFDNRCLFNGWSGWLCTRSWSRLWLSRLFLATGSSSIIAISALSPKRHPNAAHGCTGTSTNRSAISPKSFCSLHTANLLPSLAYRCYTSCNTALTPASLSATHNAFLCDSQWRLLMSCLSALWPWPPSSQFALLQ